MNWLALALVGTALFAGVVVLDRTVVLRYIRNQLAYVVLERIYMLVLGLLVWAALGFLEIPLPVLLLGLGGGVGSTAYFILYLKAISKTDAAVVSALVQLSPVFSLLWGYLAFHDHFGLLQYLGAALVIASSALSPLLRLGSQQRRDATWSAVGYVAGAAFSISLAQLCVKVATTLVGSPWPVFIAERLASAVVSIALLLVPGLGSALRQNLRNVTRPGHVAALITVVVAMAALFFGAAAYSAGGPLFLVNAVQASQPLFVLLLVPLSKLLLPGLLPDDTSRASALRRTMFAALVVAGVALIGL